MDDHDEEHHEQVDLDGDNDIEEMVDDETEYALEEEEDDRKQRDEQGEEHHGSDEQEEGTAFNGHRDSSSPSKVEEDLNDVNVEDDSEKRAELLGLPPHGSEVFIGGLSRSVAELDLTELCGPFGEIFEIRLVKDKDTGENKGYAFVAFTTSDAAQQAIEDLHDKEYKGRTLRCSLSQAKHRLFIGNIPKSLTDEEMRKILERSGPGVENIELLKDAQNPSRNRGFVFVEYYNHACADHARRKMSSANFKMDGSSPTVTWAEPKSTDSSASAQVRTVYVKSLPENVTVEKLEELFGRHGEITKVVLPTAKPGQGKRDFGFIHFAERSSALKAVKSSEKYEVDGQTLEAVLAKPQSDKRPGYGPASYRRGLVPSQYSYPAYGVSGDPYGMHGVGYGGSGLGQPVVYGRGPMPAGMRMVPMVLPDGRLGYVFQQPGAQASAPPPPPHRRRHDRNSGSSEGGRGDRSRGNRYRPY